MDDQSKRVSLVKEVSRVIGKTLLWLYVQLTVVMTFSFIWVIVRTVFPIYIRHRVDGVYASVFWLAMIAAAAVYTAAGVIVNRCVEMNSAKWWRIFWILFGIYAAATLAGMCCFMGDWFFEGYGLYILPVWIAPLLWLGELELWEYIWNKRLAKQNRTRESILLSTKENHTMP